MLSSKFYPSCRRLLSSPSPSLRNCSRSFSTASVDPDEADNVRHDMRNISVIAHIDHGKVCTTTARTIRRSSGCVSSIYLFLLLLLLRRHSFPNSSNRLTVSMQLQTIGCSILETSKKNVALPLRAKSHAFNMGRPPSIVPIHVRAKQQH